ncbi:hypothetical protein [Promicromonospora iranensis]|uniref:Phospholipase D-like protein n=1 Tax=Promicromonospora iranensis TaxID=1105144 RepID=A0ABU2CMU8_9MICO|nr:hypothetical protein [Promicromonospora iranensis]MDR7382648.1 hypothetical protein [Promicromonospora iranensis]
MTAPGSSDTADAVARVDAALDGWSGKVPAWYSAVGRIGYWWIAICLVGGLAIGLVANPSEIEWRIASGLMIGIVAIPVGGTLLRLIARSQSRATGAAGPERALADAARTARPVAADVKRAIDAVLARDARQEPTVHRLAWRSNEDDAALKALDGLWRQADPESVAARDAETAALEARVAVVREQAQERARAKGKK